MSTVVHIDPAGRREMDSSRDYLDLAQRQQHRNRVGSVVNFTSRLEQNRCIACGQEGHRASKCKQA